MAASTSLFERQFQASLMQFQQVLDQGGSLEGSQDPAAAVLEDLVSRQLLSQAARANGYTAEPDIVQERFLQLIEKMGSTRDGGSFEDRMSQIACWNSLMDESQYLLRQWQAFTDA